MKLERGEQSWNAEQVEVSNGKGVLQSRTLRQPPGTMGTAGGLSREVNADVPLAGSLRFLSFGVILLVKGLEFSHQVFVTEESLYVFPILIFAGWPTELVEVYIHE